MTIVINEEQLKEKIRQLAKERDALLIAHNYMRDEVQEIADITGDSLGLSIEAQKTDKKVIVFCGVHFMAESAAILSPEKTILLPRKDAGCPMADMVTPEKLRELKQQHPDATVVTYVNSSAAVKAESDICCTSSNAVSVARSLDARKLLLVPDRNLGHYIAQHVPEKECILWPGYCPTHDRLKIDEIQKAKDDHPDALLWFTRSAGPRFWSWPIISAQPAVCTNLQPKIRLKHSLSVPKVASSGVCAGTIRTKPLSCRAVA